MKNILNISQNFYVRGGSDSYFFALTDLLEEHGHTVIPFAAKHEMNKPTQWDRYFPSAANFENPNTNDALRYVYSLDAKRAIRRLLGENSVDVAHLHIYYGKLTSSILSELQSKGIPIVQTLHEYKLICPVYTCLRDGKPCEACGGKQFWKASWHNCNRGSATRSIVSTVESYVSKMMGNIERIDQFVAVSQFIKDRMIQNGVASSKITVVRNFVDCNRFSPSRSDGKYFLYFGRVEEIKGIETMLRAFATNPDIPLIIAGNGSYLESAKRIVAEYSKINVRFVGFKSGLDLHKLIQDSIATVLPAEWYENCPMSILESFVVGRAGVGTGIGGIPELISNGVDGFIFPVKSVEMLSKHVRYLWQHKTDAFQMGERGRAKVVRDFNAGVHYQQLRSMYERLI
jgi:glycosyltransferase involved in cell wall biosynthesis